LVTRHISTAHKGGSSTINKRLPVFVRDNDVDQALRALKRRLQRESVFREMRRRKAYEKPSERKTREKTEAIRRARKAARKQAQREGLIPSPKRREDAPFSPGIRRAGGLSKKEGTRATGTLVCGYSQTSQMTPLLAAMVLAAKTPSN